MISTIRSLWTDEDATTAVEYAVMLALIVVACLGAVSTLSSATSDSFTDSATAISAAN
ncbi:MAG: Flp family type IVb pilin [Planctomycetota bacterium]